MAKTKLSDVINKEMTVGNSFADLTAEYKKANALRVKADAVVKQLKKREDELKTLISNKLTQEGLKSVKTDLGTLSNYTFETVKTQEAKAFIAWLAEDFEERSYLLTDSPYSKPKITDFAGEEKELPPGLAWHRELKLSIKK